MARYSTMASVAELNVLMRLMTALATASTTSTATTAGTSGSTSMAAHSSPPAAAATATYIASLQRQRRPQADLLVHVHDVVVDVVEQLVGQRAQGDRQRRPDAGGAGQHERDVARFRPDPSRPPRRNV